MPEMAAVLKAAHYLGVPPWELADQPVIWTNYAVMMDEVEKHVQFERLGKMFRGDKK